MGGRGRERYKRRVDNTSMRERERERERRAKQVERKSKVSTPTHPIANRIRRQSKRKNVGLKPVALSLRDLWRLVQDSASISHRLVKISYSRDAIVCDFRIVCPTADQDVGGLDITVDDAHGVKVLNPRGAFLRTRGGGEFASLARR